MVTFLVKVTKTSGLASKQTFTGSKVLPPQLNTCYEADIPKNGIVMTMQQDSVHDRYICKT